MPQRFKGVHRLPILLRISQGKQFWIVLEGRTIDVNTPFLYPLIGAPLLPPLPPHTFPQTHKPWTLSPRWPCPPSEFFDLVSCDM